MFKRASFHVSFIFYFYVKLLVLNMKLSFDKVLVSDVAVVGSGLAGLSVVFFLEQTLKDFLDKAVSVVLISKSPLGYATSTYYSAGAFRCPVGGYSPNEFYTETLEAGRYINRSSLVKALVSDAAESVLALEKTGLRFRQQRGMLRVISKDDLYPGKELVLTLKSYTLSKRNVRVLENAFVLDVIVGGDGSLYLPCLSRDNVVLVNAKAVVLATGGAANVYSRSDNPPQLSSDGHGIALRLGLPLIDMEFVQFHPLGLLKRDMPGIILPSTLASHGKLINKLGEDVVQKYGLESLVKAIVYYRDRLSRCAISEILAGRGVEGGLVLQLEPSSVNEHTLRRLNLGQRIIVLPTAHFSMGGVKIDDQGRTPIRGVYAIGELAGGLHGANRLGGNALTACVVFARRAAKDIMRYVAEEFRERLEPSIDAEVIRSYLDRYTPREGFLRAADVRTEVRGLMWSYAGVVRSPESLRQCLDKLAEIYEKLDRVKIDNRQEVMRYAEAENTLLTALAVTHSALVRTESRGSHYRTDYPEEDPKWVKSIRVELRYGKYYLTIENLT